ncbi:hypothetical protein YC2023_101440 [Brassica napus]
MGRVALPSPIAKPDTLQGDDNRIKLSKEEVNQVIKGRSKYLIKLSKEEANMERTNLKEDDKNLQLCSTISRFDESSRRQNTLAMQMLLAEYKNPLNFPIEMGVFPGFGAWINQNNQEPPNAGFKRSENVESKSASEKDTNNDHAKKKKKDVVYYDYKELMRQRGLWYEAEKKHPWYDPPPKIRVTNKKGLYHMNIELTVGTAPDTVYDLMINPKGGPFFNREKWRDLMKNTSRKVLKENGPKRVIMVEKAVAYNVLSLTTISIPLHLTMEENRKDLTTKYKKGKVMLMKEFHGDYKVEPIYVDQKRLCKKRLPKSPEEYKKCSGGQGRIGSKLTINHYFQPYRPFNIPPLSWFIHGITIKTSKNLLNALQEMALIVREAGPPSEEAIKAREKNIIEMKCYLIYLSDEDMKKQTWKMLASFNEHTQIHPPWTCLFCGDVLLLLHLTSISKLPVNSLRPLWTYVLILLIAWPVWGAYCIVPPALDQNCASSKCVRLFVWSRSPISEWSPGNCFQRGPPRLAPERVLPAVRCR